jgi:hypothetical protein
MARHDEAQIRSLIEQRAGAVQDGDPARQMSTPAYRIQPVVEPRGGGVEQPIWRVEDGSAGV